ncbi:T9SS type A sorting domain-containing protein [bacterium]|nr:T9SS type A sorting domain-containing protein [bacterium]
MRLLFSGLFLVLGLQCITQAQSLPPTTLQNDAWDFISANRLLMWASNNGSMGHNPLTAAAGTEWPRGSGKYITFAEGLVITAVIDGDMWAGGATYAYSWQAGPILPDGTASDPNDPQNRLFNVHRYDPQWWNALTSSEQWRFAKDIAEWPVQLGAPWVDSNGNGIYDPDTSIWKTGGDTDHPHYRGVQSLFCASNAMDDIRLTNLYGSPAYPLELHTHIWADSGHPLLDDVVFREHTIINRGNLPLEDAYAAIWQDPDFGDPLNDFCGVDTISAVAYTYNGREIDAVYSPPAAAGTVWLQTPIVPASGAVARFGDAVRDGYRNIPLSSFVYYISADPRYRDPQLKNPVGTTSMYYNTTGRLWNGESQADPVRSGAETTLSLSGDPVRNHGWVDGIINPPGDRRFLSACGPFTLLPGDTQKVITATLAADAKNRLLSIRDLRLAALQLRDIYRNLPFGFLAPEFASEISFPQNNDAYRIAVSGGPFPAGTSSVQTVLRSADGKEIQRNTITDDGLNGDAVPSDGIYGGVIEGSGQTEGADLYIVTVDAGGEKEWLVERELPLPGPATVSLTNLVFDSPEVDGKAQPGEVVRYEYRIENLTTEAMGPWHVFFTGLQSPTGDKAVMRYDTVLSALSSLETTYDELNPKSYFQFQISDTVSQGEWHVPVVLMNDRHCTWKTEFTLVVEPPPPVYKHGLLEHVEGNAVGSLGYSITNLAALTDHDYRVSITGEDNASKTMVIEDVTLGKTLFPSEPVPGAVFPASVEIDGWRINIGTTFDDEVYDENWGRVVNYTHDADGYFSDPAHAWFTVFDDEFYTADECPFGSALHLYDCYPVRIVFDQSNGQKAAGYMRGSRPNYGYTGYHDIPLRVYDIRDTANPRQLMVGFSERLHRPAADSMYFPGAFPDDRELLWIFADDYATTPPAAYQRPLSDLSQEADLMYMLWAIRDTTISLPADGESYTIVPNIPVSNRDVYILAKPRSLEVRSTPGTPASMALQQNHPNPVGSGSIHGHSSTVIEFATARDGAATLRVFDMLGRCIATLIDSPLPSGNHLLTYDVSKLPTGSYLLRLQNEGEILSRVMTVVQ